LNCLASLCGPLPPSYLNLRAIIKQDDNLHLTMNGTSTTNHHVSSTMTYHTDEQNVNYKNQVVRITDRSQVFSIARVSF
jgi:hypothetical protein